MGSQVSSEKNEHKHILTKKIDSKLHNLDQFDKYSSYNGLKSKSFNTDTDNNSDSKSNYSNNSSNNTNLRETTVKVQTQFKWTEGGNSIFLTGSFSNWNQYFLMVKNEQTREFELTLVYN